MNLANQINELLAASIGVVNAVLAVVLIVVMLMVSIAMFGWGIGLFVGLLGGAALSVAICGTLAVLVNIRDLLHQLVRNRTDVVRD